jgi:hypothetical protein
MFAALLAQIKANPITTATGWVAGASGWLSAQPELAGHPTAANVLKVVCAAAVALFAWASADAKKS